MTDTLSPERLAAARARTHERIDARITRRRRWPVLAVAATAAAAAAVVFAPGGSPTRPEVATAATLLRSLDPQLLPTLGAGEYYAVRVVQREVGDPSPGLDQRYWADSADHGRELVLNDGKVQRDVPLDTPVPMREKKMMVQDGPGKVRVVPAPSVVPTPSPFPTDPRQVPGALRELAERSPAGPATTYDYVVAAFQLVADRHGTPPEVLQAAWRFLSGLPGIRLIGDVRDPLGRPGQAVAADGDANREGVGIELIVNPDTGRPLAVVHYRDGDVNRPWLQTIRTEGVVGSTHEVPQG
jgi:hypothetical protein